jgi:hypothetical protein
VIWNLHNQFMTFHHTGDLVLGEQFRPSIGRVLEFVGSQFAVFGPVVFATMIVAMLRLRSSKLIEQDRVMVAFFVIPLVFITLVSVVVHAYANWASVSIISGLILTAALLLRERRLFWLRASIGLGVAMQVAFLISDTMATQIVLPFVQRNPYSRTLGLRTYAQMAGQLATDHGAAAIVSDDRGKFAVLRYYWRDRPVQILSWGTADSPSFDTAHPLTQATPLPILFVSGCPDMTRPQPFFDDVQPLGVSRTWVGPSADQYFFAAIIRNPRSPLGILRQCSR